MHSGLFLLPFLCSSAHISLSVWMLTLIIKAMQFPTSAVVLSLGAKPPPPNPEILSQWV